MALKKKYERFRMKYYQDVQKAENLSVVLSAYLVLLFLVVAVCSFNSAITTSHIYMIHSVTMIIFLCVFWRCIRSKENFNRISSVKKMSLKNFLLLFLVIVSTNVISLTIVDIVNWIKGAENVVVPGSAVSMGTDTISIICSVIIGPIMEELIHRGAGLSLFKREDNKVEAIIFTSVVFGLMHGNYGQFINSILGGFILGYVAIEFGLVYSILLHMLYNGMVYVAYFLNIDLLIRLIYVLILFLCVLNKRNIIETLKYNLKSQREFSVKRLFTYFLDPIIFLISFSFGVMIVASI